MRIRTQLFLMAVAVLFPVILAAGIAIEKIREGEREAALRGLRETVRATALIVDREVQGSLSALKVLGNSPNLNKRDFKAFYAEAAALNQFPDVWTLLLDDTGKQVLNTIVPFGTPAPPPASAERVQQVLSSQQPLVTDLMVGPVSGKMVTAMYVRAAAAGGNSFVVTQAFSVDHWIKTALQRDLPTDWVVAVIDRNGKFISRSHQTNELLGRPARPELVAAAAAAANDGLIRHDTLEGVESYDAFTHSALTGWTIAIAAPVNTVEAAAARAVRLALVGIGLALGAAILAVAAFGQRFIGAIEGANRAAVALGRGERPAVVRTPVTEVNELHEAMADAGVLLEVERRSRESAEVERERLLENEILAREAAQAQNVAKDQFLAMLGHELRNPLAAISGAIALLEISGADKAQAVRYVDIIRRQNRHLGHIVNDLLDISRLMAGKIALNPRPLNLADALNNCVEALRTTERAMNYRIAVHTEDVWVKGDGARIEQIFNNLMTNALKFSPPGSEIWVEVREAGGKAVVAVRDAGVGIAPELIDRVFEPFFQGPAPTNRLQSGLGIGLALVRQLVELHGGEVQVTSPGLGQGCTFSFWLPAIPAVSGQALPPAPAARISRAIVYVEDNADARATMAELLRLLGYEVVEVADGAGTLPAVLAARPEIVIMDIGLPDMDGYEVARRLRADPAARTVPLIALTGYGQLRDKEAATRAGFDAHLVKPVEPDDIVAMIEDVLARKQG